MTLLNYLGVYTNDIENSVNRMEDELGRSYKLYHLLHIQYICRIPGG